MHPLMSYDQRWGMAGAKESVITPTCWKNIVLSQPYYSSGIVLKYYILHKSIIYVPHSKSLKYENDFLIVTKHDESEIWKGAVRTDLMYWKYLAPGSSLTPDNQLCDWCYKSHCTAIHCQMWAVSVVTINTSWHLKDTYITSSKYNVYTLEVDPWQIGHIEALVFLFSSCIEWQYRKMIIRAWK